MKNMIRTDLRSVKVRRLGLAAVAMTAALAAAAGVVAGQADAAAPEVMPNQASEAQGRTAHDRGHEAE